MKNEKVWKLNMVLWCITFVVSLAGAIIWFYKYFTTGARDWFTIFFFVCAAFSAVMWLLLYRREKRKDKDN